MCSEGIRRLLSYLKRPMKSLGSHEGRQKGFESFIYNSIYNSESNSVGWNLFELSYFSCDLIFLEISPSDTSVGVAQMCLHKI